MQHLDAAATRARLPAAALLEALAWALRARREGSLQAPERLVLPLPQDGRYLVMPAADAQIAITKLVSVHPHNRAEGLPTIQGLALVADARDGRLLLALDGPTLTARRTAALSALGLRTLAPGQVRAVALVGTGAQALEHGRLLAELGEVEALHLVGRTPAQAEDLARQLDEGLNGLPVGGQPPRLRVHARVEDALDAVQAVITLTNSTEPVLPARVREDLLVIGVGAFRPHMAELPPALLHGRPLVVDALDAARGEAGDLIRAGIDWASVSELVDHLDRRAPGGPAAGGAWPGGPAPVLKTVGQAAWDLAAARVALQTRGGVGA